MTLHQFVIPHTIISSFQETRQGYYEISHHHAHMSYVFIRVQIHYEDYFQKNQFYNTDNTILKIHRHIIPRPRVLHFPLC